jgi:hypothetical protein
MEFTERRKIIYLFIDLVQQISTTIFEACLNTVLQYIEEKSRTAEEVEGVIQCLFIMYRAFQPLKSSRWHFNPLDEQLVSKTLKIRRNC